MDEEKRYFEVFEALARVTGVEDVGYHDIVDGKLRPKYKTESKKLKDSSWKEVHGQHTVKVEENPVLLEVINGKKTVIINNTTEDRRSYETFALFGIDSIMVLPVLAQGEVKGIVVVASIGEFHEFTAEEQHASEEIVKKLYD